MGKVEGKGAADDTALGFPERQNTLVRSKDQSGVDAYALTPHSIIALNPLIRGYDFKFLILDSLCGKKCSREKNCSNTTKIKIQGI